MLPFFLENKEFLPLIPFTRRLAADLRPALRRAQSRPRGPGPNVGIIGEKEGLIVRAVCDGVIIT